MFSNDLKHITIFYLRIELNCFVTYDILRYLYSVLNYISLYKNFGERTDTLNLLYKIIFLSYHF